MEYAAGRAEEDLHLLVWLEPLGEHRQTDQPVHDLRQMLAHPRSGEAFLARVCAILEVPQVAARLAEQHADEHDPELVGESVVQARGRLDLARATAREMMSSETETPFEQRTQRWFGIGELVLGLLFLLAAAVQLLPGPWWIWLALGAVLAGDGARGLWRALRRAKGSPPAR